MEYSQAIQIRLSFSSSYLTKKPSIHLQNPCSLQNEFGFKYRHASLYSQRSFICRAKYQKRLDFIKSEMEFHLQTF